MTAAELHWPGRPRPVAAWAFDRYLRWLARRSLAAVHWGVADGTIPPRARGATEPLLFVANHTNWWDGFIACLLTRRLGLGFQILMEAQHLARYRAFLHVGALPIRRGSDRAAYRDLDRARQRLEAGHALWIFPQGERRPAGEPIRRLERGAAHLALAAGSPVRVVPVAFRYVFLGEQRPEAFAMIGEPWTSQGPGDRTALSERIAGALERTLATLDERLAREDLSDFEPLVAGRLSVNKRLDRIRHAVGLLDGDFHPRNG